MSRRPSQCFDLVGFDQVAAVVVGTVRTVFDPLSGIHAEGVDDAVGDLKVDNFGAGRRYR